MPASTRLAVACVGGFDQQPYRLAGEAVETRARRRPTRHRDRRRAECLEHHAGGAAYDTHAQEIRRRGVGARAPGGRLNDSVRVPVAGKVIAGERIEVDTAVDVVRTGAGHAGQPRRHEIVHPLVVVPNCFGPLESVASGSPRSHAPVVAVSMPLGLVCHPRLVSNVSLNTVVLPGPPWQDAGTLKPFVGVVLAAPPLTAFVPNP